MKPDSNLFAMQQLASGLAGVERNHYHAGSDRHENDVEHSFSLALMCWYLCRKHKWKLDLEKVLKYALVHDAMEVYAGDVNAFAGAAARAEKAVQERAALERLGREFGDFDEMVEVMRGYETKADAESALVWTVDKMQAIILGDMDGWRPYREAGITYDEFVAKYAGHLEKCPAYAREIFDDLFAYCQTTFWDNPSRTDLPVG